MSHAWSADATHTARALNMSLKIKWLLGYLTVMILLCLISMGIFPLGGMLLLIVTSSLSYAFLFTGRQWANRPLLWLLGYGGASIWMDKATVKQKHRQPPPGGEQGMSAKQREKIGKLVEDYIEYTKRRGGAIFM